MLKMVSIRSNLCLYYVIKVGVKFCTMKITTNSWRHYLPDLDSIQRKPFQHVCWWEKLIVWDLLLTKRCHLRWGISVKKNFPLLQYFFTMEEVFIGSTFKTNAQKVGIFALKASPTCVGFPIAYLFFERGMSGTYRSLSQSLTIVLESV